ncbi:hypothetical protein BMI85_15785 [Thioclava sp. DLFJ4-1]|nr:hypothetical protein BMI89_19945 [Thioclava sp. F36-7]OOY15012.1 hypothetical protein BMI85_15785 [Thioclava sp. DLFJ4-1]
MIALGISLCLTGFFLRSLYSPGIENFFDAYINGLPKAPIFSGHINPNYINILNSADRFTLKASFLKNEAVQGWSNFMNFLGILQPLPSKLVGMPTVAGTSLTSDLGTEGVLSVTTPALGEIFYLFGYSGAVVFLLYGALCGRLDKAFLRNRALVFQIMRILIMLGFVSGLHKGFRAMTRPIVYAAAIYFVKRLFDDWKKFENRKHNTARSVKRPPLK